MATHQSDQAQTARSKRRRATSSASASWTAKRTRSIGIEGVDLACAGGEEAG
jgi:hypothetical protein